MSKKSSSGGSWRLRSISREMVNLVASVAESYDADDAETRPRKYSLLVTVGAAKVKPESSNSTLTAEAVERDLRGVTRWQRGKRSELVRVHDLYAECDGGAAANNAL
jgi:hypothetical protein